MKERILQKILGNMNVLSSLNFFFAYTFDYKAHCNVMWVLNLWEILKNIEYLEKATQILGLGAIWILFSPKAKKMIWEWRSKVLIKLSEKY